MSTSIEFKKPDGYKNINHSSTLSLISETSTRTTAEKEQEQRRVRNEQQDRKDKSFKKYEEELWVKDMDEKEKREVNRRWNVN